MYEYRVNVREKSFESDAWLIIDKVTQYYFLL